MGLRGSGLMSEGMNRHLGFAARYRGTNIGASIVTGIGYPKTPKPFN